MSCFDTSRLPSRHVTEGPEKAPMRAMLLGTGFDPKDLKRIVMTRDVDAHHGILRFGSVRVQGDGAMLLESIDLAELPGWGGLQRVISFFGPLPPPVRSAVILDA